VPGGCIRWYARTLRVCRNVVASARVSRANGTAPYISDSAAPARPIGASRRGRVSPLVRRAATVASIVDAWIEPYSNPALAVPDHEADQQPAFIAVYAAHAAAPSFPSEAAARREPVDARASRGIRTTPSFSLSYRTVVDRPTLSFRRREVFGRDDFYDCDDVCSSCNPTIV